MICGNEERVIARCLEAALPHVDGFVICVNGNDGTEKIIKRVAKKLGAPGCVVRHAWRSFGHNRTLAATAARQWASNKRWSPASTYLLLLDADMILHVTKKPTLTEPCYEIRQHVGQSHHANPRLLRLSHEWKCLRRTHEYWSATPDTGGAALGDMWIEDCNDGGSKSDKYERDVRLLSEDLNEHGQDDARSLFYLGETYFHWAQRAEEENDKRLAMERFRCAEHFYQRRTLAEGWYEERWFASYKRGLAALALDRLAADLGEASVSPQGEMLLLESYQSRPGRAEPIAALATHYRRRGKNHLAMMCALAAQRTPRSSDRLFVSEGAWTTQPDEDISICAYYTGAPQDGLAACERILARRGLPDHIYDQTSRNETFYIAALDPSLRRGAFDTSALLPGFVGTNPTIARRDTSELYDVHIRLVNYEQKGGRYYTAPDDIFQTHGANIVWDRSTDSFGRPEVIAAYPYPKGWDRSARIRGLEDKRYVRHSGSLLFTATCCETPGAKGWPRVVLGHMDAGVKRVLALGYGQTHDGAREKNWTPWSMGGRLLAIYSYDPFIVIDISAKTGKCREAQRWDPPFRAKRWKGSTAPIRYSPRAQQHGSLREHYIMLVHETAYMLGSNGQWEYSIYSHRFVEITDDMQISRYSRPFFFDHSGVEYAAGLAETQGDSFLITYGFEDREARWIEVPRSLIESMLAEEM